MRKLLFVCFAISLVAQMRSQSIEIITPKDGQLVGQRPVVEGTVGDSHASVWLVVHPAGITDYWVQPPVTVRKSGAWKVEIHIGRDGTIDLKKRYEIVAFMNPAATLHDGDTLKNWPKAEARSDVVEVERR